MINDVKQRTNSLSTAVRNARNERTNVNSLVDGSRQWWKGKGADAFVNEYKKINSDVDRVFRNIDDALGGLNRLPALIERAERERKEEAAKKEAASAASTVAAGLAAALAAIKK